MADNITMKASDTLSAKMAKVFVTIEGHRYNLMNAINLEAKFEKTKTPVPILGQMGEGNKATGWKGTGSATFHYNTSMFREIVEKFRNKEQDHADFWINKPGVFIYIYYAAVRDEEGNFKGVLEVMQDCTRIRNLQGSRTLLTWDGGLKGDATGSDEEAQVADVEKADEKTDETVSGEGEIEVTPDTKLTDLLAFCPQLKEELPKINSKFKMLNSPMGRVMIPKATVRIMSERSEMDLDELIKAINEVLEK